MSGEKQEIKIYLICKNNHLYFKKYFPAIKKNLENNFTVYWNVYENGSTDETKELLKLYFEPTTDIIKKYNHLINFHKISNYKNKNINLKMDEDEITGPFNQENVKYIEMKKKSNIKYPKLGFRCEKIAIARNRLIKFSKENNSKSVKWCLLIDTDVVFDYENTVKQLLHAAKDNPDGVMFCANSHAIFSYSKILNRHYDTFKKYIKYDSNRKKYINTLYYDTFALNYGEYFLNLDIINVLDKEFQTNSVMEIKTGFGGVVLIKEDVLNSCEWSTNSEEAKKHRGYKMYGMCEHYAFCDKVRKYGKIYIVKNSTALWMKENGYQNDEKKIPKATLKIKESIIETQLLKEYINYSFL